MLVAKANRNSTVCEVIAIVIVMIQITHCIQLYKRGEWMESQDANIVAADKRFAGIENRLTSLENRK